MTASLGSNREDASTANSSRMPFQRRSVRWRVKAISETLSQNIWDAHASDLTVLAL